MDEPKPDWECTIKERPYRDFIVPVFLPLMRRPCRSVEKESAESCMRALLLRTCAELRLKRDG